jgi:hypothetical protein
MWKRLQTCPWFKSYGLILDLTHLKSQADTLYACHALVQVFILKKMLDLPVPVFKIYNP